jgi:hypothetical protein
MLPDEMTKPATARMRFAAGVVEKVEDESGYQGREE